MVLSPAEKQREYRAREAAKAMGRPANTVTRAAVSMLMARAHGDFADAIASEHFAKDAALPNVIRAASSPTTTSLVTPTMLVADLVDSLTPASAGAALLGAGIQLNASGGSTFQINGVTTSASADFVGELAPIPVETSGSSLQSRRSPASL